MTGKRWTVRPPGSNWGDFGDDDQLGRLNLLTAEKVRQGIAEVQEGQTFCLSLPLDYPGGSVLNPRRRPPVIRPTVRNGRPNFNYPQELDEPGYTDVTSDDSVHLYCQYSTQWDSLAHAGCLFDADGDGQPEIVYYNGYCAQEDIVGPSQDSVLGPDDLPGPSCAEALGIERMAEKAIQGRGVLLDLRHHFGDDYRLIGYEQLMDAMGADGVVVEPGDMLCLHSGFADMILSMKRNPDPERLHSSHCVLDGRDRALLDWIGESGIAALIADNYAVEAVHPRDDDRKPCAAEPLHEHCLFKLGLPLGELWHLTPLAEWLRANGRSRFLLTAPPLRLPGAVGSPVTPVATV